MSRERYFHGAGCLFWILKPCGLLDQFQHTGQQDLCFHIFAAQLHFDCSPVYVLLPWLCGSQSIHYLLVMVQFENDYSGFIWFAVCPGPDVPSPFHVSSLGRVQPIQNQLCRCINSWVNCKLEYSSQTSCWPSNNAWKLRHFDSKWVNSCTSILKSISLSWQSHFTLFVQAWHLGNEIRPPLFSLPKILTSWRLSETAMM